MLRQGPAHHSLNFWRDHYAFFSKTRWWLGQMLLHYRWDRASSEWDLAGQHLKENDAEAVNISPGVRFIIRPEFGRHVRGRSHECCRLCAHKRAQQFAGLNFCETEIQNLDALIRCHAA